MHYLQDLSPQDLKNKKIIVRVDFNVPMVNGKISDDSRIKANLQTIKYLIQSGVDRIFLISHMGKPVIRPKEKIENIAKGNANLVLKPVAERLAHWLKIKNVTSYTLHVTG